jgi:UDP-sugar transporter A1/2/3
VSADSFAQSASSLTKRAVPRLVTLAVQNALLAIIMHYSRVSRPASQAYSAAVAVLMNELLKGTISFAIAFARIDSSPAAAHSPNTGAPWSPRRFFGRLTRLGKEVFSPDCWKLSIPAILYGKSKLLASTGHA